MSEVNSSEEKQILHPSSNNGFAHIKEQYIIPVDKRKTCSEDLDNSASQTPDSTNSRPNKKQRTGRNHNRPRLIKESRENKLCRSFWSLKPGETVDPGRCPFEKCCFSHDVEGFMEKKPEDLGDKCHNFSTYGFCPYGLICRYGGCHIKSCRTIVDEERYEEYQKHPPVRNTLKKEVQIGLRKRTYDFSKAKDALKEVQVLLQKAHHETGNKRASENVTSDSQPRSDLKECVEKLEATSSQKLVEGRSEEQQQRMGPASDEDLIPPGIREKKKIDWTDKLYLAPLTTLGNLPYRRVCKRLGADVTCSEMALATSLLQGSNSEWALVKRHSSEDCFGVQLCGNNADVMTKCAQLLDQEIEMDFVDINMGCPIDLIYKQGGGSALMRREGMLRQMVLGMNGVLSCPLTLKMRTGIYRDTRVAHTIIEKAKAWHVELFTLHGRSKEQRYLKSADWDYIDECASVAAPTPLFGNGDILTYDDYVRQKKSNSNVAGVMLARGALMKPWLFTEIKERRQWDISSSERLDILREYANYGLEHWGSDSEGVEKTRRFLLEWLSFLYRYIPVGLLERPQMINQRPTAYMGRDDLETLMASNNVNDWIKLSEMLLGPVPKDFAFLPKHKANSWG